MSYEPSLAPMPKVSRLQQARRLTSADAFRFFEDVREECGDVFRLRPLGMGEWVVVCAPEVLTELFRKHEDEVVAGEARGKQFGYLIGDDFSLCLDGEPYFLRRRAMLPFLNGRRLLSKMPELWEIVDEELRVLPEDRTVALLPTFEAISRKIIQRLIFGPSVAPELDRLCQEFFAAVASPWVYIKPLQWNLPWTPYGRFLRVRDRLFARLDTEIQRMVEMSGTLHLTETKEYDPEDHLDLISSLVAHLGASGPEERQTIAHEVQGVLIGGSETTSKMLAWSLLELLERPDVVEAMRQELDDVVGDGELKSEHLRKLPYAHAVVEEGLRLRAPAAFPGSRLVKKDIELGGYRVRRGSTVVQALALSGVNEHFPQPTRFEPEANQMANDVHESHAYPFGGGIRKCTGQGLARLELTLVLSEIVRRFDIERVGEGDEPIKDGIAYAPTKGLEVRLRRRESRDVGAAVGSTRDAA